MLKESNNEQALAASSHILTTLFAALFLALVAFVAPAQSYDGKGVENLKQIGKAFASTARKVSPAVVFIQVEKVSKDMQGQQFSSPFGDDFFRRFFGRQYRQPSPRQYRQPPRQQRRVVGQGSGFIIAKDGYIMTNNHVVGGADKITVKLEDGREFKAKIIGTDPHSDVAIIKIDAKNLPVLPLGDSDSLEVGEWVIAVGNPFGLSHTLTAGIVSAKGRSSIGLEDYENFIQTDAAINPGNSGGPLVDLEGKAVGMNTAIYSRSGGYMGIGFAIPINMAKSIRTQLMEKGSVTRGYLGILVQQLTPELAKSFGLENKKGILVAQVSKDSPAEKAGMLRGDVIVAFEGRSVEKVGDFRNHIALKAPGTREPITVVRDGIRKDLIVSLGKLPEKNQMAAASPHNLEKLGLAVQDLSADLARRFGYEGLEGVVVTQVTPGSVAAMAGIRPGTLIQEANRKRVTNTREFQRAVDQTSKHGTVLLLVREGDSTRYVALNAE